jgi:hypothetical protein
MVNKLENSCIVCKYPITDPMCGRCYIREIKAKLNDLGYNVEEEIVSTFPIQYF